MKEWLKQKWSLYYKPTYRVVIFIVAALLMVLSFPTVERVQYEYELLRPWRHEDIIAPFDFPIYKSDVEYDTERDSILANFPPYYRVDSISSFDIEQKVDELMADANSRIATFCPTNIVSDSVSANVRRGLLSLLNEVYDRGVVELPEQVDSKGGEDFEFMLIKGNVKEPFTMSELFSMAEAYKYVVDRLERMLYHRFDPTQSWVGVMVERLPIAAMIDANVVFDSALTYTERDEQIASISHTSGLVQADQKIISTGDIVDPHAVRLIESFKKAVESHMGAGNRSLSLLGGEFLMVLTLLASLYLFLYYFRHDVFRKLRNINFILLLMTSFVIGAAFVSQRHENISFILPYVIVPIMLRIFFDSRLAMYVHTIMILIISFLAYDSQYFIILHIPAGMVAIVTLVNLTRRGQIVRTSIFVFLVYIVIFIGHALWQEGALVGVFQTGTVVRFAMNALLLLLSYPLIYVFERGFGFISDVTLLELSDSNNDLLRQLSEKAPGTFQHSVQVGNLGQEVAIRIGANGMMVRAGAMYHDIGKVVSPMYFTENQAGGINPHDGIDFVGSAKMIIQHVENGVTLAQKHNIPRQVIDIIKTHHGKSQAKYFYISWCNAHPGEEPDMSQFTYPGPLPQTKEEAIVMMADVVEASSKSLKEYTDKSIDDLVEKVITMQVEDKQFRNAPITFRDIEIAKEVFKEKLKNIYHGRIQYPELLK